MTARSIVCGSCSADVPYGRLSCPSCGELLASVSYIYPQLLRWAGWPGDARLLHPADLLEWLTVRGWQVPSRTT